jgi:hypothetical protein
MTKDEALRQALEALENAWERVKYDAETWWQMKNAITALEAALAQPERQPLTDTALYEMMYGKDFIQFARAIEQAHDIGGNQ